MEEERENMAVSDSAPSRTLPRGPRDA